MFKNRFKTKNKTETLIKNGRYVNYCYNDENISSEYYYQHDKLHRDSNDGPAVINYYRFNGSVYSEFYYQHDKLHRLNGPAVINYYYDKNVNKSVIKSERYFVNNIEYDNDLQYCVAVGCCLGENL